MYEEMRVLIEKIDEGTTALKDMALHPGNYDSDEVEEHFQKLSGAIEGMWQQVEALGAKKE